MDRRMKLLEKKEKQVRQQLRKFASGLRLASDETVSIEVTLRIRKNGRVRTGPRRVWRAISDVIGDALWAVMLELPLTNQCLNLIRYSRRWENPARRVASLERVGIGPSQIDHLNAVLSRQSIPVRIKLVERGIKRGVGWPAYQKCHYKFYRVK